MGGNLAITIREEQGLEHRMDRWTNSMPDFINSMKFINRDVDHYNNYIKQWYDFVNDWKQAKGIVNKCKLPMTSCYATHPYLAPSEYGQVVIDYKTKKILSLNQPKLEINLSLKS